MCGELDEIVRAGQSRYERIARESGDVRNDEERACNDRNLSVCVHFYFSFFE
jgi:hypothetical protein